MFDRLPDRVAHGYLIVAFFLLPAAGFVLSAGQRPPNSVSTALLWGLVVHHSVFIVASTVVD